MGGRSRKLVGIHHSALQRICVVTAKPERHRGVTGRTIGVNPSPPVDRFYMAKVTYHLLWMPERRNVRNGWKADISPDDIFTFFVMSCCGPKALHLNGGERL